MKSKFLSLTASEFFLRGTKFLFFLILTNFYSSNVVYEYGYFTAFFSILFVLSDFGYQTYLIKELSQKKSFSNYMHCINISLFRVGLFILVSLIPLIYYIFTKKEFFIFIFILFFVDTIVSMSFAFYRALGRYNKEIKLKFIMGFVFIFVSYLGFLGINVYLLFTFLVSVLLIYSLYEARYIQKKYISFFVHKFTLKIFFESFDKTLFIFLASLATIAYLRIDILMLEWFGFVDGVIYYTIASRVLELTLVFPTIISAFLLPRLVQGTVPNHQKELFQHFFIGLSVMLLFLFLSNFIISQLFADYNQTIVILNILLFTIPFMLLNNYGFTYFVAKNSSKNYFLITIIMLLLNLILNIIFITKYGYIAAAYTTLATEVLGSFIIVYVLRKKIIDIEKF